MLGQNSKKLREHIALLIEREACRVSQVKDLFKLNDGLLKVKEAEAKALGKELEQVKGALQKAQKELAEARPKVVQVEELKEKLGQANEMIARLEDEIKQLRNEVLEAKAARVAEFKDLVGYWMAIKYAATKFLAKEKIKMSQLIKKAHNIEDLSCLKNVNLEHTFSGSNGDKVEEREKGRTKGGVE